MNIKLKLLTISVLLYAGNVSADSDIWMTSQNPKIFYSKEKFQLLKIKPKVRVFKFYYQVIQRTPRVQLKKTFEFLRNNNIEIAIEVPGLTWKEHGVGYAVEGFGPDFFQKDIAKRVKDAGGEIDYLAIDEDLWYAHYDTKSKINFSIDDIAKKVSSNISQYHDFFPNAKVGLIEPISQIYMKDKFNGLNEFITVFNKNSPYSISFIHYDVLWGSDVKKIYNKFVNFSKQRDIRYGVIFNDNSKASAKNWMDNARRNIKDFVNTGNVMPEDIIYQSWNNTPYMSFYTKNRDSLGSLPEYTQLLIQK